MRALAWRLAWRDLPRTLLGIAGIAVAVLIAFIEMGFLNGILDSQLRIIEAARGELTVLDKRRVHLDKWDEILPIRLRQIAAHPEVAAALPVYQRGVNVRSAADAPARRIVLLAFSPDAPPLDLGWSPDALERLREPDAVLFDRASRPIYGAMQAGQSLWVEDRRLRLAGFVELGPTVITDGVLVTSESTLKSMDPNTRPKMAVLRLTPGADPVRVQRELLERVGEDVDIYRRDELATREAAFLRNAAPIGLLFGAGMSAGLCVGFVLCYQVLYVAIRTRLRAFATLKAMGFGNAAIQGVILRLSAFYALGGFLAGLALTVAAYGALAQLSGLAIHLTAPRIAALAAASLLTCGLAGLAAARQILRSNPSDLY
ncbi:MAG: FtsX-like permease family protein [Betaproteobacteria bacterium]|nr:FtsX-like permease family protein [Betaproteobacteria bacterium]